MSPSASAASTAFMNCPFGDKKSSSSHASRSFPEDADCSQPFAPSSKLKICQRSVW